MFGDSAYGTGELREHLAAACHTTVIKPPVLRPAIGGGFTVDDFDIDTHHRTVTCPAGHTVTIGASGTASFARHCQRCPLRRRCTTARAGRMLKSHPRPRPAPRRPTPGDESRVLDRLHHHPADGERSISWLVADGCRKVRFRRLERNRRWLRLCCAAVNLKRLITLGVGHDGHHWTLAPT